MTFFEFEELVELYAKKILGVILILVGIVGLFVPILQGILFITLGVILLGNKRLKNFMLDKLWKCRCWVRSLYGKPKD